MKYSKADILPLSNHMEATFHGRQASEIAVRTAKEFVMNHPGELDVIKWVLFDDKTFQAYESQMEHCKISGQDSGGLCPFLIYVKEKHK